MTNHPSHLIRQLKVIVIEIMLLLFYEILVAALQLDWLIDNCLKGKLNRLYNLLIGLRNYHLQNKGIQLFWFSDMVNSIKQS